MCFVRKLKETVHALIVNEIKITSRNAFIDNPFGLQSEKESKNDKSSMFQDWP